ncbi:MAG: 30S ribosomal protein S20 [Ferrimicrobium sp.]
MANIKSQIKRNKQNERRRLRNKGVRSELKTRTKVALRNVGAEQGAAMLRLVLKRIDKAAAKGIIHKNQAARRKSRIMKQASRLSQEESTS